MDPLAYTPGDNEWADCHRASVGKANPLERLSAIRSIFFPTAGRTLGQNKISVTAQSGYKENVRVIASESRNFQRPVFLFNGDTHTYARDRPLASSKRLSFYGISESVPNLTRVTVGGEGGVDEWVKVKVVSGSEVLQTQRVPYWERAAVDPVFRGRHAPGLPAFRLGLIPEEPRRFP